MPIVETFQAAFTPAEQEVTVIRNVRAGISGPYGEYTAGTLEAAEQALFNAGYLVAGPWKSTRNGDQWCDLTPMS
ncbi:hypothetical protein [Streptomyces roseochromogenus]|uniref:Uncharacterized protein n=1 Tax=Streptomyces roseochromogenus subsp. oscitans DS 12.976 TaxID=1352936 RepID=V6JEA8_STRRC|nr:hypothetical protein [Streptomyces roseochromogenus]EST18063.1 hypothetical protein M878_45710 [Streptomyces roseochromogenus subsp. oscitans DS 12.976]